MLVSRDTEHKQNYFRTKALADLLSGAIGSSPVVTLLPGHGPSLLRFYAIESGLKYLLQKIEKVPFSYQVKEGWAPDPYKDASHIEKYSHDLTRMLSRLKVSAMAVTPPAGPFRVVGGYKNGQNFEVKDAQEAWRYGLEVNLAHQLALEQFLIQLLTYIDGEIDGVY